MSKSHARRFIVIAAVAALGLVFWGGCSKNLMDPDEQAPEGSTITNPVHESSLNEQVINVRGRAEVGATIEIFVNDVKMGTDQSLVSIDTGDGDTSLGAFTVADIDLGLEGTKTLRARVTDLYGNIAGPAETPVVTVTLDQTAPPIAFTGTTGTIDPVWVEEPGYWGDGYWETGLPRIIISGSTDTSAEGARLRYGINEHVPSEFEPNAGTDIIDFDITATSPPLSSGATDTVIVYSLEAYDSAGNIAAVPVPVHWEVLAQEEELAHDDGVYNSFDHFVNGFAGQRLAVRFQAPTWANYVTKVRFYVANDQVAHPVDPTLPTTEEFTTYVWRVNAADSLPGPPGNDGYLQPEGYPEDEWVDVRFPNAVEISNNAQFPDKKFYVGMEWEHRLNPWIYEDHSEPIAYKSFRYNWSEWELRTEANTMIRAVVSDVPGRGGRQAVLLPEMADNR